MQRGARTASHPTTKALKALRGALLLGVSLLLAASARAQNVTCEIDFGSGETTCFVTCPDGSTNLCELGGDCSCPDLPACTDPPTVEPCLPECTLPNQTGCVPPPPIEVIGCTSRDQIIQKDCLGAPDPLGKPLVRELTDAAITGVLEDHLLPDSDRDLILEYARENVRAHFFAELIQIISKPDRTAEEDELVAYYAGELQELRIAQAQVSEAEYAKYVALGQCGYVPPPGFTFDFPSACYTPLGIFDPTPHHPTLEEFQAYGYAAVMQDLVADPEMAVVSDGTSRALAFGIASAIAGVTALTVYVVLLTPAVFAAVVGAIAPFYAAVVTTAPFWAIFSGAAPALISSAVTAAAAAVAGAIGVAIFAAIFIIFSFIDLFDYTTFVDKVTNLIEVAESTTPDLRGVLFVAELTGMSEFYPVYLQTTLPEFPAEAPVPAASACDPQFALRDSAGNDLGVTDTIALASTDLGVEVGLRGGWFAPTLFASDPAQPSEPPVESSLLSLRIQVLDWDGKPRDVWRRGSGFITVDPNEGLANVPLRSSAETEFRFTAADGTLLSASVVYDENAACGDLCPEDPDKTHPGACGCGTPDVTSGDGLPDCFDACPNDPDKTQPGCSGCGFVDPDADGDGSPDCFDTCPDDATKTQPGECGCDVADVDGDGDGTLDCQDVCPADPAKTLAGACGCGVPDDDSDGDTTPDCLDACSLDPAKVAPGECGCGFADTDSDGDGTADCIDGCVDDPAKIAAGVCGCGTPDDDLDADGSLRCLDNCPEAANTGQEDFDGDSLGDVCDADADDDGVAEAADACAFTPLGTLIDAGGCALVQLAPCEGPPGTTDEWKNHGSYVRFLAHAANTFVMAGLMTEDEAEALLLEEGENDCGR